jgi:hypothetical protein
MTQSPEPMPAKESTTTTAQEPEHLYDQPGLSPLKFLDAVRRDPNTPVASEKSDSCVTMM